MAKWADYLISAVQYNNEHTRIIQVKQHLDEGNTVGSSNIVARLTIVSNLKSGKNYCTIYKNKNSNWDKGDNVIPYLVDGEYFIRTDGNKIKADNLGELPEF